MANLSGIPLDTAPRFANFRDFGGLESACGGRLRTGLLFRSGHFCGLDAALHERLCRLDFRLIADLRYQAERDAEPSAWPAPWAERIIELEDPEESDAPHVAVLRSGAFDIEAVERFYTYFYGQMVADPAYQQALRLFFQRWRQAEGPILIHCTAGKDRTGVLVALIHHLLGVSRDDILDNYLLSNEASDIDMLARAVGARLEQRLEKTVDPAVALKMVQVEAVYLQAAFDRIEQQLGGVEAYLDRLGLGPAQVNALRDRYLE